MGINDKITREKGRNPLALLHTFEKERKRRIYKKKMYISEWLIAAVSSGSC
jgi:hypothetical protein